MYSWLDNTLVKLVGSYPVLYVLLNKFFTKIYPTITTIYNDLVNATKLVTFVCLFIVAWCWLANTLVKLVGSYPGIPVSFCIKSL